jgi:hypothetical protein
VYVDLTQLVYVALLGDFIKQISCLKNYSWPINSNWSYILDETMILSKPAAADLICTLQFFCPPLTFSCLEYYIVG